MPNEPLRILSRYSLQANTAEVNLEKENAIRILEEHPKVKALMAEKRRKGINEEEFWKEFLEK